MLSNIQLTDEQKMIYDAALRFAQDKAWPTAQERDENHRYPEELIGPMAEMGLFGIKVPADDYGAGGDTTSYALAMEAMSELYPKEQTPQLALEEVELSPDGTFWTVVVSFARPHAKSTIEAMTGQQGTTTYKKLEIHAETGLVHSMRMHQV